MDPVIGQMLRWIGGGLFLVFLGWAFTRAANAVVDIRDDVKANAQALGRIEDAQAALDKMIGLMQDGVQFKRYQRRVYTALLDQRGHDAGSILQIESDDVGR